VKLQCRLIDTRLSALVVEVLWSSYWLLWLERWCSARSPHALGFIVILGRAWGPCSVPFTVVQWRPVTFGGWCWWGVFQIWHVCYTCRFGWCSYFLFIALSGWRFYFLFVALFRWFFVLIDVLVWAWLSLGYTP